MNTIWLAVYQEKLQRIRFPKKTKKTTNSNDNEDKFNIYYYERTLDTILG